MCIFVNIIREFVGEDCGGVWEGVEFLYLLVLFLKVDVVVVF